MLELIKKYQVLVVAAQHLTPEEQIEFCRKTGTIFPHPLKKKYLSMAGNDLCHQRTGKWRSAWISRSWFSHLAFRYVL
nr:hypothetical protein [Erwinia amylovora]